MTVRDGMVVPLSTTDTGRHAGQAEDLEAWLFDQRAPYTPRHAAASRPVTGVRAVVAS